jgi:heme-degrading monooxygenase HmoA
MHSWVSATNDAAALLPTASASLRGAIAPTLACFVALGRFVVANAMEAEDKAACRELPHHVERTAGFGRMEVLCPLDRPQEIGLETHWRCADDDRAWHRGHRYRELHRGILKGLILFGGETCLGEFEVVCE